MPINLADYENKAREAVKVFWGNRNAARARQVEGGRTDQGERAGVTAGKNMDGFVALVGDVVRANGLLDASIMLERRVLTLPGFFRPTKLWDMLVVSCGELVAALEFKSHVGPSFGNNFNNRAEEAIGTGHDLWTAYREQAFGRDAPKPFVGWMILIEDAPKARSPVTDRSQHFQVLPEFQGATYADRYNILCRKLVQEQLYTAASVLASPRTAAVTGEDSELGKLTGLTSFVTGLAGHIAATAARQRTIPARR